MNILFLLLGFLLGLLGFAFGVWLNEVTRTKCFWEPQPRGRVLSAEVQRIKEKLMEES